MAITAITRNFNGSPNLVFIQSTDNLVDITAPDYIADQEENITVFNNGPFEFNDDDFCLINYANGEGWFNFNSGGSTFVPSSPPSGLSNTLADGSIFVGNALNVATAVPMSGDGSIDNTGAFTLTPTTVTPGTYSVNGNDMFTVDASGRLTFADDVTIPGGSGITSLNGLTVDTQLFATGTSGADFNIDSTTDTHTFNIPDASATARGLITTGSQTLAGDKILEGDWKVDGVINVYDSTQSFAGGLASESSAGLQNFGVNDVRFGFQHNAQPGGFLRFQTTGPVVMQVFMRPTAAATPNAGMFITEDNNVALSAGAVATNATDNFAHMVTCGGTPVGVPTSLSGLAPFIFDTTDNQLYVYNSGWKMPSGNFVTSFTPTMGDGTNNFTLSTSKFHYIQIGNLVHFSTHLTWTSKGAASGTIQVSLPHTLGAAITLHSFVPGFMDQVTTTVAGGAPLIYGAGSATYFVFSAFQSGGSPIAMTDTFFGNAGTVTVTGTYSI